MVAVHAERLAFAVAHDWRDEREDVLREHRLEDRGIDLLDLAGIKMVHSLEAADLSRADGVGNRAAEAGLGKVFEYRLRDERRSFTGERHRGGVDGAFALDVGEHDIMFAGEADELLADAVHKDDLDGQAAEDGDVGDDVREILVGHDRAIDRDDEHVVAEHGDIPEDSPEVGRLHGALTLAGHAQSLWTPERAGQY